VAGTAQPVEIVIIGAGVVGLACAAELARRGREVVIVERAARIAQGITSRNSGVIHAGLYYPSSSLKAQLCIEGRELLYERAARYGVAHKQLGKLIVANDPAELAKLAQLHAQAEANGVRLEVLDARQVAALEPRVRAACALLSSRTGIIDAHELADSYRREAIEHGASLCLATEVFELEPIAGAALRVATRAGTGELEVLRAEHVINAAGLDAPRIAALAGVAEQPGQRQHLCKGDYFRLSSRLRGLVSRLVYPTPAQAGLGIHLTLDLDAQLRAGPDTEYIAALHYEIDAHKRAAFGAALRRYAPDIEDADLEPDYAGIRPKLQGPSEGFHDFVIEAHSAAPGLINLLGIESPGLTASPAIARRVAALIDA
jgi:L-2-hydroxyglutarate oxidase LhgO